jgi:hypothetical protein
MAAAGGGGTPWGAIAQSVGLGVDLFNNAAAARKKNNLLTQGIRQQDRAGQESAGVSGDFISQLRSSRADPSLERGAFMGAIRGTPGITGPMTASSRFRGDAAGVTNATHGYGSNLADLFARIRAPTRQRQGEAELLMNMGNAQRPIQLRAQDDQYLTDLRAGMVQPNPWVAQLSNMLQQGGSYAMSQGH